MSRRVLLCAALAIVFAGCGEGTVSNDDGVSERAAKQTVERFLSAVHDHREASACAQLPGSQQQALARLSTSRNGPGTCSGALGTLKEFAAARAHGPLTFSHRIGFRGALPHKSTAALDRVSVNGRELGAIGLGRDGNTWSIAIVCECS